MTNILRKPYLLVTVNGASLANVISATTRHGFDMRVAEATVVTACKPSGIQPWDEVVITMGGTQSSASARFTGYYAAYESQLYPKQTTLNCFGKLARARELESEVNVDMSSYAAYLAGLDDGYGHADEVMVSTILYICKSSGSWVPLDENVLDGIEGTGTVLGLIAKADGQGVFEWREGESGLSFIERLDEISLGYRTYDSIDEGIVRKQISSVPSGVSSYTFTEGVDIFRASENTTVLDARNRIVVNGYEKTTLSGSTETKDPISASAVGANPFLLEQDGSQWYLTQKVSSPMIEYETGAGISCQSVADWKLTELNNFLEKVSLTTPRDDLVSPGDIITVISPCRLGISSRDMWVQNVSNEISQANSFLQTLTCITSIPVSESENAAIMVP